MAPDSSTAAGDPMAERPTSHELLIALTAVRCVATHLTAR